LFSGFNSAVGLVIIAIAVGLIITSICFAIEWLIIRRIVSALGGQLPNIALLGELEARNVPTLYLNQVYGQYIMHFNIGLGVIIISTSYFLVGQINPAFVQGGQYAPYEILGGFFVAIVNLYLALSPFRLFSSTAAVSYTEAISQKAGAVFDLDNTLIRTQAVYATSHQPLIAKVIGQRNELQRNDVDKYIWDADRQLTKDLSDPYYDKKILIKQLLEHYQVPVVGEDLKELSSNFDQALNMIPELMPGAIELLTSLKSSRWRLVLLTEGMQDRVDSIVSQYKLYEFFKDIRVIRSKTITDYQNIMTEFKKARVKLRLCVGDSLRKEISLGNKAGFLTVWTPSEWEIERPDQTNPQSWPTYVCKDLEVLSKLSETLQESA